VVVTGKVSMIDKEKEANQVMLTAGQKAVFLNKVFQQGPVKIPILFHGRAGCWYLKTIAYKSAGRCIQLL
jgi:hypothetical protein